eukprot:TRINITY_DN48503_c0_g1_i1.p1 TRINITY_DN48503_c0_g1~~TRINITY_DN48503_c0_g1_i1.p1  ORF type:complete len:344 (+),score=73.94 TRINITY_DN48503_c0_g1_i1:68-1099(+)
MPELSALPATDVSSACDGTTVRRAAFDIGSGATKLMVAEVNVTTSTVSKVLFSMERPVSFAVDWKGSADGTLSEAIQGKGLEALRLFNEECARLQVPAQNRAAVATEVFRKAKNGPDYLKRVSELLHIRVETVPQEEEAELGFRTAVALCGRAEEEVIAWDSGGASFQITCRSGGCGSPLQAYLGTWGTGNVTALLVTDVQKREFSPSMVLNPVPAADAEALPAALKAQMAPPAPWLQGKHVVAIGGPNSMFAIAAECLSKAEYNLQDVLSAVAMSVDRSEEEVSKRHHCDDELREPASYVVPKLSLLRAVMEHCSISAVSYQPAIGSCPGLLISHAKFAIDS